MALNTPGTREGSTAGALGAASVPLSLCMIVRDAAGTLPACLAGIHEWVDEMVVVDTGSVDDTPAVAAAFGARVFRVPWQDSFAAGRNESFARARGRWLFWMDADDVIDADNARRLRAVALADDAPADLLGHVVRVHCPGGGGDNEPGEDGSAGVVGEGVTAVDHVKLVRNRPDVRFSGRIHEQLLPAIRRAGGRVGWTDLFVVHAGADRSAAGQRKKLDRDLRLLALELSDHPGHTFALFNLGMTLAAAGRPDEALAALYASREAAGDADSHLRKVFALIAACEAAAGRAGRAADACAAGLALFPEDPELLFRRASLWQRVGRPADAVRLYRRLLCRDRVPRHFTSVDLGLVGYKARHNLATALEEVGDLSAAETEYRLATTAAPTFRPAWRGLFAVLLRQGRAAVVAEDLDRLAAASSAAPAVPALGAELAVQRAAVTEAAGDLAIARRTLASAAERHPNDPEVLRARCRFLFTHGPDNEAATALARLVHRHPTDASALHNLATVRLRSGARSDAADLYRRSLKVRPHHPPTLSLLHEAEGSKLTQAPAI
ncbi:MAG: wbbL 5 [Phycisphaerales bacterium]|nr:wbbL 5 [Phycisphaerales bacterium]